MPCPSCRPCSRLWGARRPACSSLAVAQIMPAEPGAPAEGHQHKGNAAKRFQRRLSKQCRWGISAHGMTSIAISGSSGKGRGAGCSLITPTPPREDTAPIGIRIVPARAPSLITVTTFVRNAITPLPIAPLVAPVGPVPTASTANRCPRNAELITVEEIAAAD
jgi:hypothetical protein